MKLTKRQLKRIIKEEKAKLQQESLEQYQAGWHGDDGAMNNADKQLARGVYAMLGAFVQMNGVSEEKAAQMVLEEVKIILGM